MGMYDYRCIATDVPLGGRKAVFVAVMELSPGQWAPVGLPVAGEYDRYGKIDGFVPDFRLAVLANGVEEAMRGKRIEAKDDALRVLTASRPLGPSSVMEVIERSTTMASWNPRSLLVDGRELRHVFLLENAFDAIAGDAVKVAKAEPTPETIKDLVSQAFGAQSFGAWVHRDLHKLLGPTRRKAAAALQSLIAVNTWLAAHELRWLNGPTGQYFYLDAFVANLVARRRFASEPPLLKGLLAHARGLEADMEFLADEEERALLPERWVRDGAVSWFGLRLGTKALAATSIAELRELMTRELGASRSEQLDVAEVVVVDRGVTEKRVDVRSLLRVAQGGGLVPLAEAAAGGEVRFNWDEVEQQLPALTEPLAKKSRLVWAEPGQYGFGLRAFSR